MFMFQGVFVEFSFYLDHVYDMYPVETCDDAVPEGACTQMICIQM